MQTNYKKMFVFVGFNFIVVNNNFPYVNNVFLINYLFRKTRAFVPDVSVIFIL